MSSSKAKTKILDRAAALIRRRGAADVPMAEIAAAARISRQALYLHFPDRATLLLALVHHIDERRGIPAAVARISDAPTGREALRRTVALQAGADAGFWAIARAFDAVRRRDRDAQRSWEDRKAHRLRGARHIAARLSRERSLRRNVSVDVAADLIWVLTSLKTWEELVIERGWTARQYQTRMMAALTALLIDGGDTGRAAAAGGARAAADDRSRPKGRARGRSAP